MRRRPLVIVLIAILALAGSAAALYVWIHHGFSARDQPSAIEAFVARRVRMLSVPAGATATRNPIPFTPSVLAEARAHFADHCATCHANNGSGDTEIGRNLYPKAPDMRLPATQDLTDGQIYYIINNGIRLTGMPAWGPAGDTDTDSWKLVYFIRHLPKLTPDEVKMMEALNPKSPVEMNEEQQDEQFLNGQPQPPMPSMGTRKPPAPKKPKR